ncbi:GntR family transcriptional regulator [Paramicrobacterium agarici]|uniref:GntR family transcriptional regulator n=1 Tax=Paramicrobacterium agarici TaxID=630514 RepID=A0A2A9DSW7_9MICO|nr:GntR family transcriptional regulator [Microbacterium agarici]PFG29461.1 GntR family transcriptional regulator [Microbacterium agarici]
MRASDRVYAVLREEILDGALPPGTTLTEVEQSTRLGYSRTPVREALGRLTADGLVEAASARALVVTDVSGDDISALYELREALEVSAARLAAKRRDQRVFADLHDRFAHAALLVDGGDTGLQRYYDLVAELDAAIDAATGNAYLTQALRSVRLHSARVRRSAQRNPERLRQAASEHLLICQAIRDGDVALAGHATHVHLSLSRANALAASTHSEKTVS